MKKILCLVLALFTMFFQFPAVFAEGSPSPEEAEGYQFDFTFHLNPEAFSSLTVQRRLSAYAELLSSLRFTGTWKHSVSSDLFELNLNVIPSDDSSKLITLRVFGTPADFYITSPLFGNQVLEMVMASWNAFCLKTYYHMGIPMQYLSIVYPYSWEYAFSYFLNSWAKTVGHPAADTVIPSEKIHAMTQRWAAFLNSSRKTIVTNFIGSVGLESGTEDLLKTLLMQMPDYFWNDVVGQQDISVVFSDSGERWSAGENEFYSHIMKPGTESFLLSLPEISDTIRPVFAGSRTFNDSEQDFSLKLGIAYADGDDLLILDVNGSSFPLSWPSASSATSSFSLSGSILRNFLFYTDLMSDEQGNFTVSFRQPAETGYTGDTMLSLSGSLTPLSSASVDPEPGPGYSGKIDLLRMGDSDMASFANHVARPAAKGLLSFVSGLPTTGIQQLLDDLEESGILPMLLQDE